jgi:hypothetical protein
MELLMVALEIILWTTRIVLLILAIKKMKYAIICEKQSDRIENLLWTMFYFAIVL